MANALCASCGKPETGFFSTSGEEVCRVCYYSGDTKAADARSGEAKVRLFWTGVVLTPIAAVALAVGLYWMVEQDINQGLAVTILVIPGVALRYGINAIRQARS